MNISCDVIKDILPIYAEDMVSAATRELVEEHLCWCGQCAAELSALKRPKEKTVPAEVDALQKVAKQIRTRRIWAAAAAVMVAVSLVFWMFAFMTLLIPATYEETIESVSMREDGSLEVHYKPTATLSGALMMQSDANVALMNFTSRFDRLFPRHRAMNMNDEKYGAITELYGSYAETGVNTACVNYWYFDGSGDSYGTLLYDAGREVPEDIPWSGSRNLYGYFAIAATLGALLAGLAALLKEYRWVGRILAVLAGVFGSFAVSTLVLTAGRMVIYHPGIVSMYLIHIVILSILLFSAGVCAFRLRSLSKTE